MRIVTQPRRVDGIVPISAELIEENHPVVLAARQNHRASGAAYLGGMLFAGMMGRPRHGD